MITIASIAEGHIVGGWALALDGDVEPVVAGLVMFLDQLVELVVVEDVEEVFSASGKILNFGAIGGEFGWESDVSSITV